MTDPNVSFFAPLPDDGKLKFEESFDLSDTKHMEQLCLPAVKDLQLYLNSQKEWEHNFGLANQGGPIIGKMFGVLLVQNHEKNLGYLAAFSGKLSNKNTFSRFVPPVYDTLQEGGFLNTGMLALGEMSAEITRLREQKPVGSDNQLTELIKERKAYSAALQEQLFESYHFLNQYGEEKSLIALFKDIGYRKPPAGAGECAAPKLLQYAFKNELKPLALTEFWWGLSPKSQTWKHKNFYRPCKEKCEPILKHMLKGF
ncbi:MAG: pseudouridylate synthase [Pedobacter sp.]|nr:MAG: pseudouridylate synthase [Pedobacter sp.]